METMPLPFRRILEPDWLPSRILQHGAVRVRTGTSPPHSGGRKGMLTVVSIHAVSGKARLVGHMYLQQQVTGRTGTEAAGLPLPFRRMLLPSSMPAKGCVPAGTVCCPSGHLTGTGG